ncbi:MAG: carbon starvation protein A [Myxococcales bacterium]|nr:carbon starvation protein A [Myxococcales bacterium]
MAAVVAIFVLACFALGYRFYARFIGERIYRDDEDIETPAHALEDGQDFVPTQKHILFGHHFTSIAGAAPIIGPCVAAYWGWLPALVWVVLGTIFMGAVHDFGALVVSVREKGRSVADIADSVMGPRARLMFLCFVVLLIWLVLAVFAMAIAGLFVSMPSSVLPINIEIVLAVIVGLLIYKKGVPALWPSIVAVTIMYLFVWVGTIIPIDFTKWGVSTVAATRGWVVFLFVYSAIASLLPVWALLQPRDFINSHQLFVGLGVLFLGLIVAHPHFDAPAIRPPEAGAPPLFPLLFVTVACGAISGFHGLVSSGTTSKQLDRMRDARPIGYGAMLGEGSLALASTMAAVAGVGLVGACALPGQGAVPSLSWHLYYDTWAHAGANKASAFVLGGGAFLEALGFPADISQTVMAVLVISFAATTLDTAARIQRFILAELGQATRIRPLENRYVATVVAIVPAMALAFGQTTDPASGEAKALGWVLWPIFGASNEMLAALTLMVLSLYFWLRKRPVLPLLLPMLIVTAVSIAALFGKLQQFLASGHHVLAGLAFVLLMMTGWMLFEGISAVRRHRGARAAAG